MMTTDRYSSATGRNPARATATAAALTATLGRAAGGWVVTVRQMNGMDMGVATQLPSFTGFVGLWLAMLAAMMLPGAAPSIVRRCHTSGALGSMPLFVGSYLAVWMAAGIAVYALYRPHSSLAAGTVVIAAGIYELTPLKQYFRRRCRERFCSGLEFGVCCIGSGIGLMLIQVALGIMSITWMGLIGILMLTQKLLPAKGVIHVPLALAVVGLGSMIVIVPAAIPGLLPPMSDVTTLQNLISWCRVVQN